MGQFDASVGRRELPFDWCNVVVALLHPGIGGRDEGLLVWNAPVGALAAEHAELLLRDIEPTAMYRCVVQLQTVPEAFGFGRFESLI